MAYTIQTLRARHHEIIRQAFLGRRPDDIARAVGITRGAVHCILRSPLVRAELDRLRRTAEDSITNVPLRVRMLQELESIGQEAVAVNKEIMTDPEVSPKVRSSIAKHFMDRVVFEKETDETGSSYREILRKLDTLERGVRLSADGAVLLPPDAVIVEKIPGGDSGNRNGG